jgi:quinol monooxygenase YgiN
MSDDHSSSQVSWLVELQLQPGALQAFRELTEEMVVATFSEPGALIYERSISTDETRIIVFERYADADAAIRHLDSFVSLFGERFSALVTRRSFTVFGAVTDELEELLAPLGATFARHLTGFVR